METRGFRKFSALCSRGAHVFTVSYDLLMSTAKEKKIEHQDSCTNRGLFVEPVYNSNDNNNNNNNTTFLF
ncbi:hypothetical protein JOB18_025535 [Solea senegalensis]|uniref:Uncharacterized protein n=1 Tax=Solea senegalensis TaxID=28829 RepID=A0AAV6QMJ7_SOLSE|nr:hypothetical protein JOB18_025535 [Solea senegalensis]